MVRYVSRKRSQLPFSSAEITVASLHHLGAESVNVLANNQMVAHPVKACWVTQSKNWDREAMPWLKQ